jgi:hypothetical protein
MSNHPNHAKSGHGDYERSDVDVAGVVYFLIGLAIACVLSYFIVRGLYAFLERHFEAEQTPVSPLVTNAPVDTRHLPQKYKTDSQGADYEKYLNENFPAPQLETDERTQLNEIRLHEEDTLSTYDWLDQKAGTVRIPIDRAMDLLAQRGLPVRTQMPSAQSAQSQAEAAPAKTKGKK